MAESLSTDLKTINKLDSQKKIALSAFLILLFVASIVLGGRMSSQKNTGSNSLTTSPTTSIKARSRLAVTPVSATLKVGMAQTISVDLIELPVTAVDIVLNYDPSLLAVSNIQNGTLFDRVIVKKIDNGTITFSAAVSPNKASSITTGNIFKFQIKTLKESPATTIVFDTQKTITALEGANTIGLATGGTYKIIK